MKQLRKITLVLISIGVCCFNFIGCGGDSKTSNEDTNKKEVSINSKESTNNKPTDNTISNNNQEVVLKILSSIQTESEAELEKKFASDYMAEHSNVKIEFIPCASNDLAKTVVQLATSEDLPDAITCFTDMMPVIEDMNIAIDHSAVLDKKYLDSLDKNIYNECCINDKLIRVPWFIVPSALIYRSDWLKEAGMDTIEDMDDFVKVAKAFTKDGRWGFSMVGTNNSSGTSRFVQIARAFGVNEAYQGSDGKWKSDLTTDKYKNALQTFVDISLKDGSVPPGAAEAGYPEASNYFAQEQTGLMITGSNAIGVILEGNPSLKGKIGCVPIPKAERHVSSLNTTGYTITTACKNPEVMADYLKFLNEPKNANAWLEQTGRLPVTKDVLDEASSKDQAYKGFADSLQYFVPTPSFGGIQEINDVMGESYNSMLGGSVTIDQAMERVKERVEEILNKYNK